MKDDDAYLKWKKEFEKSHCKIINKSFFIKCIVGAGALIPYKRGDDDVGWFISYSHS